MSRIGRIVGILAAALCAGAMVGLLFLFSPQASAEDESALTETAAGNEGYEDIPPEPPRHNPFKLYPDGEHAVSYDAHSEDEKAKLDKAALWAESGNGYAVHAKYSALSRARGMKAREKQIEQLAGVQGLDEVGVQ